MLQIFLIVIFSILTTVSAQLCLKKGLLGMGNLDFSLSGLSRLLLMLFQNVWLLGGLFLFGVSFLFWLFVLSKFQLSMIYPVVVSCNFCLIAIASWFLFKEHLSSFQIIGIAVIIFGIFLVMSKGLSQ